MPSSRKSRKRQSAKNSRKVSAVGRAAFLSKLKKLEKRYGQRGAAKIIGVSPRSLRRYKQGTRKPRQDVVFKVVRAERKTRGPRVTKSVKLRRARTEKVVQAFPELRYFEKREDFRYSDTQHVVLYSVEKFEIPELIAYLGGEGCGAALLVISGVDAKTGKRQFYSTEVMNLEDFAESWEELYNDLRSRYQMRQTSSQRIDLVGIRYLAPSVIER